MLRPVSVEVRLCHLCKNWLINSNAHHFRTCLERKTNTIIDPSTPQNHLQSHISMWDTLYVGFSKTFFSLFFLRSCHNSSNFIPIENLKSITKKDLSKVVDTVKKCHVGKGNKFSKYGFVHMCLKMSNLDTAFKVRLL